MSTQSLKPGWKMVKFGDIAQNVAVRVDPADAKTDVYVGLEHLDPSTIHLRQWGHPSDVTGQKLAFKKGDVIFGRRRAYQRKLAVAEFDGICSAHAMVVRAKPKMILPEFLPFFLQSDMFMERAIEISVGSLSPTINWKTLREQVFPLPPLDEQKCASEILREADEAVERYLIASSRSIELKKTIIRNVVDSYDSWIDLSEVALNITSGSRGWAQFYSENGSKFVRITNLNRGDIRLDLRDLQHVTPPSTLEAERTRIKEGDLLISITADLGLVAVAHAELGDSYVNQHIAKVTIDTDAYDPVFAGYFLTDITGQKQFFRLNDQGAKAGMNLKNVAKLKLPRIPEPEQKRISAVLIELDKEHQAISRHIEALRISMKMVQNEFVTGKTELGAAHV